MSVIKKFEEVLALYHKHGWQAARVLMSAEARAGLTHSPGEDTGVFAGVRVAESDLDAMWFKREAQGGREAWELRLVGEPPFALLELFEADEEEEDREDVRREMEARMRERIAPSN
jgi:hypothetical protein